MLEAISPLPAISLVRIHPVRDGSVGSVTLSTTKGVSIHALAAAFGAYELEDPTHHPGDPWTIEFPRVAVGTGRRVVLHAVVEAFVHRIATGEASTFTLLVRPD